MHFSSEKGRLTYHTNTNLSQFSVRRKKAPYIHCQYVFKSIVGVQLPKSRKTLARTISRAAGDGVATDPVHAVTCSHCHGALNRQHRNATWHFVRHFFSQHKKKRLFLFVNKTKWKKKSLFGKFIENKKYKIHDFRTVIPRDQSRKKTFFN